MDLFKLHNVVIDSNAIKELHRRAPDKKLQLGMCRTLHPVFSKLVVDKPTWRFNIPGFVGVTLNDADFNCEARSFHIFENGELLGTVSREFSSGYYKILITNERIKKERQRASGYKTDNVDRAIAFIRKNFRPNTTLENVNSKSEQAEEFLERALRNHEQKHRSVSHVYISAAQQYVLVDGFEAFLDYAKARAGDKHWDRVLSGYHTAEMLRQELASISAVREAFGAGNTALIIRDADKYIVRIGDAVKMVDDNGLHEELRGKLGLLKLVEKEQIVPDVGCRVSDEVFVVMLEAPNKVSEGE